MRLRRLALALVAVTACTESAPLPFAVADPASASWVNRRVIVTSGQDAGPGTLRAALDSASADTTIGRILIAPELDILYPSSTLTFSGPQPLEIDGNSSGIVGNAAYGDIFRMTTTSTVTIKRLGVYFASGNGLTVVVPEHATGTVRVILTQVSFIGNRRHGVLVNDQPQYLLDESSTAITGSPASIRVQVTGADFTENGNDIVQGGWGGPFVATPDADGLRVNEGGEGSAVVIISGAAVHRNGDDGIEVDERGNGNIDFRLSTSSFSDNGQSTVPGDKGDGVRLEESGAGTLTATTNTVDISASFEQALDLSESGAGKISASLTLTNIKWHLADAVRVVEDAVEQGGGDISLTATDLRFEDNGMVMEEWPGTPGTATLVLHERGTGNVVANLIRTEVVPGFYSEWFPVYGGLLVREEAGGTLQATLDQNSFSGHSTFGVHLDELGSGNLVAKLNGGFFDNNGLVGIQAGQAPGGTGTLTLTGASVQGNAGGTNDIQVIPGQVSVVITP